MITQTLTSRLKRSLPFRADFGIRSLLPEWRSLFSRKGLRDDIIAAATVTCVALPLSMAIALASGVKPEVGLVTAIVGGVVGSLLGGTRLAVTGPAAAMAVLVASIVETHGLAGLLIAVFIAGGMQVATGVLGLGRLVRFVPLPVVLGFTAGIGAIILIGQLPRALGLPPPTQDHVVDVVTHVGRFIHEAHWTTFALTGLTVAIVLGLPRLAPRAPAPLVAVVVTTLLCVVLKLDVAAVGEIPRSLPPPRLPDVPAELAWGDLLASAAVVYALASLESLLSSSAVDRMAKTRHDADQELIGQGFANVASACFGGIPATGVIARSGLNVQAGAKTRRSAFLHAVLLVGVVYVFAPVMRSIPIAALAGVLFSLALRMLDPRQLVAIWRVSRLEAAVFVITFLVMVFFDLVMGVQTGIIAALIIAAIRLGKTDARIMTLGSSGHYQLSLGGPLTFMSQAKMDKLRSQIGDIDPSHGVVLDLSETTAVDVTGADALREFVEDLLGRGCRVALLRPPEAVRDALRKCEGKGNLTVASSASDIDRILGRVDPWERLAQGVERFRTATRKRSESLFRRLAKGQEPHTLFITCSDSRVGPNLITSTEPGELFIHRNIGNIVPPCGADSMPAEGATVEYAVSVLGVKQIIVCGHSGCGAMRAIMEGNLDPELRSVAQWLHDANEIKGHLPQGASADDAARENVLAQLEHVRTYPMVQRKLERGELTLSAWFYDIPAGEIEEWDPVTKAFTPIARVQANGHHYGAPAAAAPAREPAPIPPRQANAGSRA